MARNLFFTAKSKDITVGSGEDAETVTGYKVGNREIPASKVNKIASYSGTDLIMLQVGKEEFDKAQKLPGYLGSSYLEIILQALVHEAHIRVNDPTNYVGKYYTVVKNLKDCIEWLDGVDGEGNQIKKKGSPVEWFAAGMPPIQRFRRPVEYFTGDRGKVM